MKSGGICLKCKAPILVVTGENQLFCGICAKEMNEQIKAKRIEQGKTVKGKTFVEAGGGVDSE